MCRLVGVINELFSVRYIICLDTRNSSGIRFGRHILVIIVDGHLASDLVRFLVATNSGHTSTVLCDYLEDHVTDDDTVYAINSLPGDNIDALPGEDEAEIVQNGREALDLVETRLDSFTAVESHQLIRGNDPAEDIN